MAAKKFGLKCKIFMGAKDIKRQRPNVEAMRKNGAKIVPVTTGSQTLVDAVSECMRYWVANCDTTHMCVGSTVGPNIFVKICAWSTAQISRELMIQVKEEFGKLPKKIKLLNCVGGGSSAMGFWNEFMDTDAEFIGVEAGGPKNSKLHAAPLTNGSKIGILHGSAQYVIQNKDGQIEETESISAGLDYPGVSPIHCFLKDAKRARYTSATDEEALDAFQIALRGMKYSLGRHHPNVAAVLGNVGNLQKEMGDLDAAYITYQEVLAIESYRLGLGHADIAITVSSRYCSYSDLEQLLEFDLYKSSLYLSRLVA